MRCPFQAKRIDDRVFIRDL